MKKIVPALVTAAVLAGCSNQALREVGRAPAMSPIGSGLQYGQTPQLALYPKQPRTVMAGYSTWNDQQSALFKDARAINVGDILTVNIKLNDEASFDNETERKRTNSSGMSFGITGTDSHNDLSADGDLKYGSNTNTKGEGTTARSEKLTLLVAAVVTGVLENGNLVISGSQEVRVNHELRILNVAGVVRPKDVDSDNMVSYERIAEARISYGGRGRLTEVQQPPWGQQLVDLFSPL
ncbi:flagellar basal body L-ring protein FlgH [Sinorhizobium sp. BG8]|uniref:flagellar basal body L-ring protein FlgH n=1 Tax=Sinorhizobium sp. BG8 TaxID=2613773 RepID=UPI00193C96EC|nr:flagellar basal body L-ring protein FlgH [Sinorhizobium sp. BG8]QRM54235.1 flagellar basal body L-ring protein FlgH [Sinorhizobium sp. BG8]